jgi:glycosyltransferase involved in cell wall biosynthesis
MVPAGDVAALAAAMDSVAQTPLTKLSKMGLAARARVLARHDVEVEAEKLASWMR